MIHITRKEHFCAAHKLFRPEWSDEKNLETFGKCSNPNWHGHNYILRITVKGNPDPLTGFVLDLKKLSSLIKEKIIDQIDHRNLNMDVPFMKNRMPSTEVLAIAIWEELLPHVNALGAHMHCVSLYETENNSVEYFG